MVKINVTGNAHAHKLAYGRGIHLVSRQIADRMLELGIAEELDTVPEQPEAATTPEPVIETAQVKTRPKKKKRGRK